jgi:hypothetical protein
MCGVLSHEAVTVTSYLAARLEEDSVGELSRCPVCCEHGVSNEAWCEWCEEQLEFGTSEYVVTEAGLALPCVHADHAKAS